MPEFNLTCMNCKKWNVAGKWITIMPKYWPTDKPVSHGLCPECYAIENKKLDERGVK